MKYIHVDADEIIHNQLPKNWRNVSNLRGLEVSDPAYLLTLGWRPLTEVNADYDGLTQDRSVPVMTVTATDAIATYTISWITNEADGLQKHKDKKLAAIRSEASAIIVAKWPAWLQNNIALGLDPDLAASCTDEIASVRVESNGFEDDVNALAVIQDVIDYTYTFTELV